MTPDARPWSGIQVLVTQRLGSGAPLHVPPAALDFQRLARHAQRLARDRIPGINQITGTPCLRSRLARQAHDEHLMADITPETGRDQSR
jgi:hypothetical protein